MSNIQQLRKLAIKAATDGTLEQISAPFKLYKGGYGFIGIQYYAAVTPNTTNAPFCSVYKTSIDLEGKRIKGIGNYNMKYVDRITIDGFLYSLFECPMPKEFTDTEGDLQIVFNYADTDGQGISLDRLPSNIFNTYVSAGGWNNEGVQLEITSQEAAQINANKIAIEELRQGQDDFISEVEDLIEEAENAITNFANTPNVINNNFEIANNTTVLKQTSRTPSTNIETTLTKPIPVASVDNDGQMSKDDVIAIQNLNQRINALENVGTIYSVLIPTDPSQTDLQALFETTANVGVGTIPPDGTQLKDVTQGITYQYFVSSGLWELLSTPQIGLATNDSPGLVQGSFVPGQIYIESDGRQSVNGWDATQTNIGNLQEQLPSKGDTTVKVAGIKQSELDFTSDPQTQLNEAREELDDKLSEVPAPSLTVRGGAYAEEATEEETQEVKYDSTSRKFKVKPSGGITNRLLLWDWKKEGLSVPPVLVAPYILPFALELGKHYKFEILYLGNIAEIDVNLKLVDLPPNQLYQTSLSTNNSYISYVETYSILFNSTFSQISSASNTRVYYNSAAQVASSIVSSDSRLLRIIEIGEFTIANVGQMVLPTRTTESNQVVQDSITKELFVARKHQHNIQIRTSNIFITFQFTNGRKERYTSSDFSSIYNDLLTNGFASSAAMLPASGTYYSTNHWIVYGTYAESNNLRVLYATSGSFTSQTITSANIINLYDIALEV